jgi:hypothetical protein
MAGMAASCESELVVMVRINPYLVTMLAMLGIKVTQLRNWGQVLHPGIPVKLTQRK